MRGSAHENVVCKPNNDPKGRQDKVSLKGQTNLKRKWVDNISESKNDAPHRTRGKWVDYCHLNDPFSDNEDENINIVTDISNETFSVAVNDGAASLKDVRWSEEWPEWEEVIKAELAQLHQMETWRLVDKPPNAIPTVNKWVFAKKRNK